MRRRRPAPPAASASACREPAIDWNAVRAHVAGHHRRDRPDGLRGALPRARRRRCCAARRASSTPTRWQVDGRRLTARRIVIAAGSRAAVPPIPGLDRVPFLTNETLFDLPQRPSTADPGRRAGRAGDGGRIRRAGLPRHPGGSRRRIAAARIRSWPTACGRRSRRAAWRCSKAPRSPRWKPERPPTWKSGYSRSGGGAAGPALVLADGRRIAGSHLLVAVGRRPNLEGLELEAGNVRRRPPASPPTAACASVTNRRVFAVGDIADPVGIGPRAFTHVGSYHAGDRHPPRAVPPAGAAGLRRAAAGDLHHPELAQVGMTEAEARAAGLRSRCCAGRWPRTTARSRKATRPDWSSWSWRAGRVVGAGILAPSAGEMIGTWTLAIARAHPRVAAGRDDRALSDPRRGGQARRRPACSRRNCFPPGRSGWCGGCSGWAGDGKRGQSDAAGCGDRSADSGRL